MKTIDIEWRHLQVEGETCERCGDTGVLLRKLVADLNWECEPRGVRVQLTVTPLEPEAIEQSNQMLIDGHPLEASVPSLCVGASRCDSCGELTGREETCRTLELGSESFEVPPAYLIRDVICRLGQCC